MCITRRPPVSLPAGSQITGSSEASGYPSGPVVTSCADPTLETRAWISGIASRALKCGTYTSAILTARQDVVMALPGFDGLKSLPVLDRLDLVPVPVAEALRGWSRTPEVAVVEIDPDLADTAALTEAYGLPLETSANCVLISGSRGGEERIAACIVSADTRADVNNVARKRL